MTKRLRINRRPSLPLALAMSCLTLSTFPRAHGNEEVNSIENRITQMERAIERLARTTADAWIDTTRAAEVDAIIREVLADTRARAQGAPQFGTVGYRGGFYITDPDNRFRLRISGFTQVRFAFNHQGASQPNADDFGFDLRRARLKFDGHVVDERIGYVIGGSFARGGIGAMTLSDAYVQIDVDDSLELRVGRFRPALLREDGISAKRLPLIERSLVRAAFGEARRAGAGLTWTGDRLRFAAGLFDDSPGLSDGNAWRARGRVEWLAIGDSWRDTRDATGFRGDSSTLLIGAGLGYADGQQPVGSPVPESHTTTWTADATWQSDGWSVLGAVAGADMQIDAMSDQHAVGAVLQGGVFVTDKTELVGRVEWGDADDGSDDLLVATLGVNHYIAGHGLKVGADVGYAFNQVGGFWSSGGAAVRTDAPGADGQIVARAQFQIVY